MSKSKLSNLFVMLDRVFQLHPKRTVLVMFGLLTVGICSLFIRRYISSDNKQVRLVDEVINHVSLSGSTQANTPSLNDLLELRALEKKLKVLMEKDSLTTEDSLFMQSLNKKLDRILLYEKD